MSFGAGHCHLGTSVASVLTQVGHQGTSSVACVLTQVSAQAAAALTISTPLTQLLSLVAFTYKLPSLKWINCIFWPLIGPEHRVPSGTLLLLL